MRITECIVILLCFTTERIFSKKPNVLLIIVDDLKPRINCFGDKNAYTPNIDALAEKSFVFKNAFAQQALCAPSRNSFLTSRRPDSLHLYDFYNYWRTTVGNFTTLPQFFKENGYYTYSIGKVFHPGISSNFTDDYPYSWSKQSFHPKTEIYQNSKVCINENGELANNLICPVLVNMQPEGTLPDLESLNEALSFLRYKDKITNKPYFLAVGFHKPHIPLKFPLQYLNFHPLENITLPTNRWRPSLMPDVAWNPWTDIRERDDIRKLNASFPYGPLPDNTIKKIIQAYDAATSFVDDLLGKLLKEVKNDTIIVFTGDHGWSLGEHGEFAKYSNFEESTRVPFIIHVPGLSTRKITCNKLVELVDIFPTLVDLTQISDPLPICSNLNETRLCTEGLSLVPIMVDEIQNKVSFAGHSDSDENPTVNVRTSMEKSAIFTQYPRPGTHPTAKPNSDKPRLKDIKIMGYSIKTKRYRYTEWVKFNPKTFTADWKNVYGIELYDHLLDPKENMNLSGRPELKTVIEKLRHKLILGWRYAIRKVIVPKNM